MQRKGKEITPPTSAVVSAKNAQTDTIKAEVDNLVEPQVVLGSLPVGESQANRRVVGVIDCVKSQIHELKLVQHEAHG